MSKLTCVTGYWNVKNKHGEKFNSWFEKTLNVDHPYIFFCDNKNIVNKHRKNFPTEYIDIKLENFYLHNKKNIWTDPVHCPSEELNIIWNEKVFLLQRAVEINPYSSDWFLWVDAGLCIWRNRTIERPLVLNYSALEELPEDKFIFSSSNEKFEIDKFSTNVNYHYVSGVFLINKKIVNDFCLEYKKCLDNILKNKSVFTDQIIYTHIYLKKPDLFFKLSHGYGAVAGHLFY